MSQNEIDYICLWQAHMRSHTVSMRSPALQMDHKPLRHKHRRVLGGATVPGVIVLSYFTCMLLMMVNGYGLAQHVPIARQLLEHATARQLLGLATARRGDAHGGGSWTNLSHSFPSLRAAVAARVAACAELRSDAEELVLAASAIMLLTAIASLAFVCVLWRRINQQTQASQASQADLAAVSSV